MLSTELRTELSKALSKLTQASAATSVNRGRTQPIHVSMVGHSYSKLVRLRRSEKWRFLILSST